MRQLPKDLAPWKHLVIINYDYVPKFSLSCDDNLGNVKKKNTNETNENNNKNS